MPAPSNRLGARWPEKPEDVTRLETAAARNAPLTGQAHSDVPPSKMPWPQVTPQVGKVEALNQDRAMLFPIPMRLVPELLTGRLQITNLPDDSLVTRVHYDIARDSWALRVVHVSYQRVREGCSAPYAEPLFEKVEDKRKERT